MSMNFSIILDRLRPGADYNFDTVITVERSRKSGEAVATDNEVSQRVYDDYDKIIWNNTPVVSLQDCITEWALYLSEQSNDSTDEKRRAEYGSWQEQMDMMYHDSKDGTTIWIDHVQAVKDKHPK